MTDCTIDESNGMSKSQSEPMSGVLPQGEQSTCGCESKTKPPPSYIYALGRIQTRFPTTAIEKEFAQVIARGDNTGLTDWQAAHAVLSKRENRYIARKLCWVLAIEGLETYILIPRDPGDLDFSSNHCVQGLSRPMLMSSLEHAAPSRRLKCAMASRYPFSDLIRFILSTLTHLSKLFRARRAY